MATTLNECRQSATNNLSKIALKRHALQRRSQLASISLALLLPLLRVGRVLGAEDEVGYRKSYYREGDNRISVSTDVWRFDVGLKEAVRVSGEVVVDAISGATPNGAPPPATWNFQKYGDYFQSAYRQKYDQLLAGGSLYDFYHSGQISYNEFTNAAGTVAAGQATAAAAAAYHALTNSPLYRSRKVILQEMHEHRNAFNIAVPVTFGAHQFTPSFAYSAESDYVSYVGALNYALALNDKNTTVSTGWAHNGDTVWDRLNTGAWYAKTTDSVFLGLVQLFGPKAYLTVNGTLGFEHGFLADPYRIVLAENILQDTPGAPEEYQFERRPRHRNTEILYASWTQFVTPLNGSYEVGYRFFHDSYGISANTVELDWHQKLGKALVISPTFRYYRQNAADFYYLMVPDSHHLPSYFSADYRLSELDSIAVGVTITWRVYKHLSIDAAYLHYSMAGLDGQTSPTAYPTADMVSIGARVWF